MLYDALHDALYDALFQCVASQNPEVQDPCLMVDLNSNPSSWLGPGFRPRTSRVGRESFCITTLTKHTRNKESFPLDTRGFPSNTRGPKRSQEVPRGPKRSQGRPIREGSPVLFKALPLRLVQVSFAKPLPVVLASGPAFWDAALPGRRKVRRCAGGLCPWPSVGWFECSRRRILRPLVGPKVLLLVKL